MVGTAGVNAVDTCTPTSWTAPNVKASSFRWVSDGAPLAAVIAMFGLVVLPLVSLAVFVAFDVHVVHQRRARLTNRWQARHEGWLHVARGVAYTLQFFFASSVWFEGAWHAAFAALCGVNATVVTIAVADMLCERDGRRSLFGLPEARTFTTSPRKIEQAGPHRRALAGTPG
jgi:hypothetical protein